MGDVSQLPSLNTIPSGNETRMPCLLCGISHTDLNLDFMAIPHSKSGILVPFPDGMVSREGSWLISSGTFHQPYSYELFMLIFHLWLHYNHQLPTDQADKVILIPGLCYLIEILGGEASSARYISCLYKKTKIITEPIARKLSIHTFIIVSRSSCWKWRAAYMPFSTCFLVRLQLSIDSQLVNQFKNCSM